jgi:hypothetical protein
MQGHEGEDHTKNIGEAFSGCGKPGRKKVDERKEDERINCSKLGRMGMMGEWMKTGT